MYGIVYKAIQDLITDSYGADEWEAVKEKSGVDVDFFISNEPYSDDIMNKLAGATSEVLGITVDHVLNAFGEWCVLKTIKEKYGGFIATGGENLREFLVNLPLFHNRIMLMHPMFTSPEFKISNIKDNSISVHYHFKKEGLQEFVKGLLAGLAKMYKVDANVEFLQSRNDSNTPEIFKVTW